MQLYEIRSFYFDEIVFVGSYAEVDSWMSENDPVSFYIVKI